MIKQVLSMKYYFFSLGEESKGPGAAALLKSISNL
jgi:hypothetical protein